jgi:hypothetical protein
MFMQVETAMFTGAIRTVIGANGRMVIGTPLHGLANKYGTA